MKIINHILLATALLFSANLWAQTDSLGNKPRRLDVGPRITSDTFMVIKADTATPKKDKKKDKPHGPRRLKRNPLKAAWMSAAFPGLGQAYNRQWWKVPVDWAIVGGAAYLTVTNAKTFFDLRNNYRLRVDGDPNTIDNYPNLSDSQLRATRDQAQNFYELSTVGLVAAYVLNVADAFVSAHLRDFDVSDDLSLKIGPVLEWNNMDRSPVMGFGIGATFK